MGQTAENLAHRFGITRTQMDEFAARSHARVVRAQENGRFLDAHDGLAPEIAPIYERNGTLYKDDDGVRKDSTVENLAKLKPFFDRKYGNVTAGNSSQITDGAAWLLLASEEAVKRHDLGAGRPHRRLAVGRPRSGADGPRPGARGDADPAAPPPRAERPRRLGDQRGVRGAGDRLHRGVEERRLLARAARPRPGARRARPGEAERGRRRDRARPSGRRLGRAHRAAPAARAQAQPRASAGSPRSASAAVRAARCWSKPSERGRTRTKGKNDESGRRGSGSAGARRIPALPPRQGRRRDRLAHVRQGRGLDQHVLDGRHGGVRRDRRAARAGDSRAAS